MKYLTSSEIAFKWNISERSVRNYCNNGRVEGAILQGKTWLIPENAEKPKRQMRHSLGNRNLLTILLDEKESQVTGGIYHKLQIETTYNSNHIEGSRLTHDQTRFIYETKTIGISEESINVDDIIETSNHFRCVDLAIESANYKLTESLIKQFHFILKSGTSDSRKPWHKISDYKMIDNENVSSNNWNESTLNKYLNEEYKLKNNNDILLEEYKQSLEVIPNLEIDVKTMKDTELETGKKIVLTNYDSTFFRDSKDIYVPTNTRGYKKIRKVKIKDYS